MKSKKMLARGARVIAVYLFYRAGEPLVALASGRDLPIEAEQLEGLLSVVGNFVETSVPGSRGYATTAMRYEDLGIVAVRGEFLIAAAVYDGVAYDALKDELLRTLRAMEERHWRHLGSWEEATKVAEAASEELSKFLHDAERAAGSFLRKGSAKKAKRSESS
jgi:hypothetical protein